MIHDHEYYRRREHAERTLARAAVDPAAAQIHADLAERYAALVHETRPTLRIVAPAR